jgi:aminoglycoside phosphotransferase
VSEATYTRWAAAQLNVTSPSVKRARSGDNSTVFEITAADTRWFLKIGDRLARECAGLRWLQDRLPVLQVVAFDQIEGADALLTAAIPGTNLAALAKERPPGDIVEMLASAPRPSIRPAPKNGHSRHMSRVIHSSMATPAYRI